MKVREFYNQLIQITFLGITLTAISLALFRFRLDCFKFLISFNECDASSKLSSDQYSEIQNLRYQVATLSWQLLNATEKLQSLTSFREKFPLQNVPYIIPATIVIRRDSTDLRVSFMVDRGKDDGVCVGAPVIFGYSLVGRVFETTARMSRILHVSDPAMRMRVNIISTSNGKIVHYGEGISIGTGNKSCELRLFEKGYQKWEKGEVTILTSGLDGDYPQGLVIGTSRAPYSQHEKKATTQYEEATYDAGLFWNLPIKILEMDDLKTVLIIGKTGQTNEEKE